MSRRSCFARGAQRTRLAIAVLGLDLLDEDLDIEFFALTGVQFAQPVLNLSAQRRERIDPGQEFAANLLLYRFGKLRHFRQSQFKRPSHAPDYIRLVSGMGDNTCGSDCSVGRRRDADCRRRRVLPVITTPSNCMSMPRHLAFTAPLSPN